MGFLIALEFLTIVSLGWQRPVDPGQFSRSLPYFPWVGLILGLVLAGTDEMLGRVLASDVVNALLVVVWIALTGAIHLDGLMDSCDGLLATASPERRMQIMKDSRVGGFGVVGGVAVLLLKYAALGALSGSTRVIALILAPALSRWALVYAMVAFPYGRSEGLGSLFKPASGRLPLLLASLGAVSIAAVAGGWRGLSLLALVLAGTWIVARFALSRIPGLTGDVYGAINELDEVLLLLAAPLLFEKRS